MLIDESNFFKLDEYLPDNGAMDAGSSCVTVHLTDESKTVGGYSPADAGFRELCIYILNLSASWSERQNIFIVIDRWILIVFSKVCK